jgi:hypothetical protein
MGIECHLIERFVAITGRFEAVVRTERGGGALDRAVRYQGFAGWASSLSQMSVE